MDSPVIAELASLDTLEYELQRDMTAAGRRHGLGEPSEPSCCSPEKKARPYFKAGKEMRARLNRSSV
jgi:hypothetical protein